MQRRGRPQGVHRMAHRVVPAKRLTCSCAHRSSWFDAFAKPDLILAASMSCSLHRWIDWQLGCVREGD
jgi:hypothetical protein